MKEVVRIYTDGASSPRLKTGAGWTAIIILPDNTEIELSGRFDEATNNQVEVYACIEALWHVRETMDFKDIKIEVTTDSEYLQKGASEWVHNWVKNKWKSKTGPVKNKPLWECMHNLMQDMDIEFFWVRGHTGHEYNERCDKLASKACRGDSKLTKEESSVDSTKI